MQFVLQFIMTTERRKVIYKKDQVYYIQYVVESSFLQITSQEVLDAWFVASSLCWESELTLKWRQKSRLKLANYSVGLIT